MIEINIKWDYVAGIDMERYTDWAKRATAAVLRAPGLVEHRANRSLLGAPYARAVSIWESLADWARFDESAEWQALNAEMRKYATNISVEAWGPTPVSPETLYPKK